MMLSILISCIIFLQAEGFGRLCGSDGRVDSVTPKNVSYGATPKNLRVAFIGDQGLSSGSRSNLRRIRDWIGSGPGFVIHAGDFEYRNDPTAWMKQINDILPISVPYFATIGNHDVPAWSGYQAEIEKRERSSGVSEYCVGETATNQFCSYQGVNFVLSGVGTRGLGHSAYITRAFENNQGIWRFCAWHKNQRFYQTGTKSDETGYEPYDACRNAGAIIHTGHEHSFSRTKIMRDFSRQVISSSQSSTNMTVYPGRSFAWVSGVAGVGIRGWAEDRQNNPWWAAAAALDNGLTHGTMFCEFHTNNNPREAQCEFKDINGKVWDSFQVKSRNDEAVPDPSPIPYQPSDRMIPGTTIRKFDRIFSSSGSVMLGISSSGYLRIRYTDPTTGERIRIWRWPSSSRDNTGRDDDTLVFQSNGDLQYISAGTAIWSSGTSGSNMYAVMQNDCNFVIYDSSRHPAVAVWATGTRCPVSTSSFLEFPVTSGEDDVSLDPSTGLLLAHDLSEHTLSATRSADGTAVPSVTRLTFHLTDPALPARIHLLQDAHLQVMGSSEASKDDTSITISTREGGPAVDWDFDQDFDDWEQHEVWLSPNLRDLVLDAYRSVPLDTNVSLSLMLTAHAPAPRAVYAYEHSPCVAPTLSLQFREE